MDNNIEEVSRELEECDICQEILPNLGDLARHIHTKHPGMDCKLHNCWSCIIRHRRKKTNIEDNVTTQNVTTQNRDGLWKEMDEQTRYYAYLQKIDNDTIPKEKSYINTPIPRRCRPVNIPLRPTQELRDPRKKPMDKDNHLQWVILDSIGCTEYIYNLLPPKD